MHTCGLSHLTAPARAWWEAFRWGEVLLIAAERNREVVALVSLWATSGMVIAMYAENLMQSKRKRFQTTELTLIIAWLTLGVFIRLVEISQPFVDDWSWRQADVAMIADNFYRHGHRILYPQINWAGNYPGYVGTEFQLVALIASLLYPFFGEEAWVGRSISIAFFAASMPFFYLLVKKIFNSTSGIFALGIYTLATLSIFASRSFMPDMASLSFSIAALFLFLEWLENETGPKFVAAVVATSLAILVKLPAIIIGVPFFYLAWQKHGWRLMLRRDLWALAALSLAFPLAWYTHTYLVGISDFPNDVWILGEGHAFRLLRLGGYAGILSFTLLSSLTLLVSVMMLIGIGIALGSRGKFHLVFHWWLAAIVLFLILAGERSMQPWYELPIVPVAGAFGGTALHWGVRKLTVAGGLIARGLLICLFFAGLAALSYMQVRAWYESWANPLQEAGIEVSRITRPDALIVFVDDGNPAGIYYSRRRGWHFLNRGQFWGEPADSNQAIAELEALKSKGATYLIFTKYTAWWLDNYRDFREYLDARYPRVRQNNDFVIFDLRLVKQ